MMCYNEIWVFNLDSKKYESFRYPGDAYSAIEGWGIYCGKNYSKFYIRVLYK